MGAAVGTITRRMNAVLDGLQSEFKALCDRTDFESKIEALKKAGNMSDRSSKLKELFKVFDKCGIKYERGQNNKYYETLVKNADILSFSGLEDRMLIALFSIYEKYLSPEEYMKRIVDRLSNKEDGWESDSLRLRILKQFIKYGNYLSDTGFGGRNTIRNYVKGKTDQKVTDRIILLEIDDHVFDGLSTATKEQKKPNGPYGLLKTADDLASGNFREGGATKKSLYLFAMVYGMTYYSGDKNSAEIIDYKTDIESNLFRDYYANNLMRYVSAVYREKKCEFERDPSGQGINYKNFAEMIYLYYISKDCSPLDKIKLSSEMIKRVINRQFKQGKVDTEAVGGTVFYRALFSEDIIGKPEKEFEDFICENYDCDTYNLNSGFLQMETEQNSAYAEYQAILKALQRELAKRGGTLESCNYGLWFTDVAAFRKKGYENICDRRPDIDRDRFTEFIELLLGINSFLGYTVDETISNQNEKQEWNEPSKMKTRALYVDGPASMTRTSLIVAYYYYYNTIHENDPREKWKNFEEVFNSFKTDIDSKLDAAYYQTLSGKNIFDVLVVFSSYAYLNM